jgi:hypothetical protein
MNKEKTKHQIKESGRLFIYSFISSLLTILLVFLIITILNSNYLHKGLTYYSQEWLNRDDMIVQVIHDRCVIEETEREQMYCVYNIVNAFYRYESRDDKNYHTPTTTLVEGGVCRDAAVMYCTIFSKLGIYCDYVNLDNHVYNIIQLSDGTYCNLDQWMLDCVKA